MKHRLLILLVYAAVLMPWSSPLPASAIEASYRQARSLVDQSLGEMNAGPWLRDPTPFLVELRGGMDQSAEHLGTRSGDTAHAQYRETWAWNPDTGVLGREYRQLHADGYDEWVREVFTGSNELWHFDLGMGTVRHYSGKELATRRDRILRRFVPLLLDEALEHGAALRFAGRFGPFDSVQMHTAENESLTLFFGRESRHLGWVEYLTDLPTFGDTTVRWKFSEFRPVEGIANLPHRIGIDINDQPYSNLEVVRFSRSPEEVSAFLALGDVPGPERVAPPTPRLERLHDGVYRLADVVPGTHVLAIEFETSLMVVDAPATRPLFNELPVSMARQGQDLSSASRRTLQMLHRAFPGKPVRRLLLSHFHSDNAGGLMAFSNSGVELLVSDTHAADVREYLAHAHTLRRLEVPTPGFSVSAVGNRRIVQEGARAVEIIRVGPNPHSEDMLATWIPEARVLWVGDLQRSVSGRPDASQRELNRFFEQWLERQALAPEWILTAHGGGFIDLGDRFRVDSEQTHHLPRNP